MHDPAWGHGSARTFGGVSIEAEKNRNPATVSRGYDHFSVDDESGSA
jgi:hypothetical protein